jgi:putative permease
MLEIFKLWYHRYLSDPQAVLLLVLLVVGFTIVLTMGDMLAPVLAALVIAYLLEAIVQKIKQLGLRRRTAVFLVWVVFVAFLIFLVFGMLPLFSAQIAQFIPEVTTYWQKAQAYLMTLPDKHSFISAEQVQVISTDLEHLIGTLGKKALNSASLASITTGAITIIVYLILLPLMVFFFLKDKWLILNWFGGFLPSNRTLATEVWVEMDKQLGNYIRGKFWEILIVGIATYIVFVLFGLKYSFLLAVLVGLSVIIPYIGATVVTIPVAVVAFFQWGLTAEFYWLVIAYLVVQALDGNLLVPWLFSNVVNVHPIAIIISILVFGGLWGFWGVFFAIPLATLVNALVNAWPRTSNNDTDKETVEA